MGRPYIHRNELQRAEWERAKLFEKQTVYDTSNIEAAKRNASGDMSIYTP